MQHPVLQPCTPDDAMVGVVAQDCIAAGEAEHQQPGGTPAGTRLLRLMASARKFVHARVRSSALRLPAALATSCDRHRAVPGLALPRS